MFSRVVLLSLLQLSSFALLGQTGKIKGYVLEAMTNEPIPFVNIVLLGYGRGTTTDINGKYELSDIKPGVYNVVASFIGYQSLIQYEVRVVPNVPAHIEFLLEQSMTDLDSVVVKAKTFNRTLESPVSIRTIGATEISRSPGGNRDISKVLTSLPGVASTVSFRNDIIIRGGAPGENRFYLDGIEVPNINHFATQGSSGGPVGMLNVNFLREVDFYSGAFPADRGNALSSVLEFKQITGNDERVWCLLFSNTNYCQSSFSNSSS